MIGGKSVKGVRLRIYDRPQKRRVLTSVCHISRKEGKRKEEEVCLTLLRHLHRKQEQTLKTSWIFFLGPLFIYPISF